MWAAAQGSVLDWVDVGEMVTAANFTPNGQGIAVGTAIGNCRFYSISVDGELSLDESVDLRGAKSKKLPPKKVTGIQHVPGSSSLVLVSAADSRLQLFQAAQLRCKLQGHKNVASHLAAAVSASGDFIVCPSEDGSIFLYNPPGLLAKTGQPNDRQKAYEYFACPSASSAVAVWPLGMERRRVGPSQAPRGGVTSSIATSSSGLLPDQPRLVPRGTSNASPSAILSARPGTATAGGSVSGAAAGGGGGGSTVGLFYGGGATLTPILPSPSPSFADTDWEQSNRGSQADSDTSRPATSASVGSATEASVAQGSTGATVFQYSTSTDLGGSGEAGKAMRERFEAAVAAIGDGEGGGAPTAAAAAAGGDAGAKVSGQGVQEGGSSVAAVAAAEVAVAATGASKPPLHSAASGASRSPLRLFSPSWTASDELAGASASSADSLQAAAAAVAGTEGPLAAQGQTGAAAAGGTAAAVAATATATAATVTAAAPAPKRKEQMPSAASTAGPTQVKGRAGAAGVGGGGGEGGGWQWGDGTAERASALGLVIVTASFTGELRVYQNMAGPSKG
ncbi:hypothetical protein CLOM_g18534 [Closterium sp. NIES-68]|nr:hypothetical protein CLOM_g18534 [Closterium sp. NIES-68]